MSLAPCSTPIMPWHYITPVMPWPSAAGSLNPCQRPGRRELVQECWLLILAVDDLHRIEMHPLVQNGRVDAPEVHVRVEITLHQLACVERRHVTVVSALDLVAEHEGDAGGTMIGSRTVVAHATAELGENQHDHV